MKKIVVCCIITISILSCGSNDLVTDSHDFYETSTDAVAPRTMSTAFVKSVVNNSLDVSTERKVVKTGYLSFKTKDAEKTKVDILSYVEQLGGYVADDSESRYEDRLTCNININVPAFLFDSLICVISKSVGRIESRSFSQTDVTTQYIDLETRLQNKKELEKRYIDLLAKAKTVTEIVSIEREMGTLRSDIESTERQFKYLEQQIAYSTLNISFYQKDAYASIDFTAKLTQAFTRGWQYFTSFCLFLVRMWIFILLLIVGAVVIWKRKKRNNKK